MLIFNSSVNSNDSTILSKVSEGIFESGEKKNLYTFPLSTYSIFIPPFGDVTIAIDPVPLSNKNER